MMEQTVSVPRCGRLFAVLKELVLCGFVLLSLLMIDRSLENIYPYFLYGTGKRIIDLWIAFEMHMHVWLKRIIPAVFVLWIIVHKGQVRLGLLVPIAGVYVMYLVTSLLTSGYTSRWWNTTELPMLMILFLTVQCSSLRGVRRLSFCGNVLYCFLLLCNAVFCLFPQLYDVISGWRPDYFLSADNLTGFPMIFGLVLAFLDGEVNHSKLRKGIYIALFYLNLVLIHCASALMAGLILTVYFLIPWVRRFFEKRSLNLFTVLSLVFCGLMTGFAFYTLSGRYESIAPFFERKRSIIIRMILWYGVFGEIMAKPLLGYGLTDAAEWYARPDTTLWYNAHNAWLQTWHEGGIVLVITVLTVLALTARILKKAKDRRLAGFFSAVIFSELIMMQTAITAWFVWGPLFMLLQMAALLCPAEERR